MSYLVNMARDLAKRVLIPGGAEEFEDRQEKQEGSYQDNLPSGSSSIDRLYHEITADTTPRRLYNAYIEAEDGDLAKLFSIYKKAHSYDGRLRGASSKRIKGASRYDWEIEARNPDIERTSEIMPIVQKFLQEIKMKTLVRGIMKSAMYGVSAHLMEYKKDEDFLVPEQPKPISVTRLQQNNSYQIPKSKRGKFGELLIWTGSKYYSADKLAEDGIILLSKYDVEDGYYDIGGFARSTTRYFLTKQYASKYWLTNSENYGSPLRIMKIPRGHYDLYSDIIEKFFITSGRNKYGVVYKDWEVEMQNQSNSSGSQMFKDLISFCNTESEIAIHGQAGTTDNSNSAYASTKVFKEDEVNNIIDDCDEAEEVISDGFVKDIINKNYPDYPAENIRFKINKPRYKNFKEIKDKYELAARMGLTVVKSEFEEETGIKIAKEGSNDSIKLEFNSKGIDKFNDDPDTKKEKRTDGGSVADKE